MVPVRGHVGEEFKKQVVSVTILLLKMRENTALDHVCYLRVATLIYVMLGAKELIIEASSVQRIMDKGFLVLVFVLHQPGFQNILTCS